MLDQSLKEVIGVVICPNMKCRGEKSAYITRFEELNKSTYECKQCKAGTHVLNTPFKDQKPCVTLLGWTYCFRKKTKLDYQNEPLMRQCISQSKLSTTEAEEAKKEPAPKKTKILPYMDYSCHAPIGSFTKHKFTFLFILQTFLQLTTRSFTINTMRFTVPNNGTQWVLLLIQ